MVFLLLAFDVSPLDREYDSQPGNYDSGRSGWKEMFTMILSREQGCKVLSSPEESNSGWLSCQVTPGVSHFSFQGYVHETDSRAFPIKGSGSQPDSAVRLYPWRRDQQRIGSSSG